MKKLTGHVCLITMLIVTCLGSPVAVSAAETTPSTETTEESSSWIPSETYTGVAKDPKDGKYYRIENGKVNTSYTGLAKCKEDGKRYYFKDGVFQKSYTGLARNTPYKSLYRVKDGIVDFEYTGLVKRKENGKWYFLREGKWQNKYTGVAQIPGTARWYYVKNGIIDRTFTGLAKRPENKKWYYIRNGRWNKKYAGSARIPGTGRWYYVKDGTIDKTFNGGAKRTDNKKWYYFSKGKLNKKFNGFEKVSKKKTYYYRKGKRVYGRKTINGKVYFFDKKTGILDKVKTKFPEATDAAEALGNDLYSAFQWAASSQYVKLDRGLDSHTYARYTFAHHQGDCYGMAAAFYEMAKVLGYKVRMISGSVPLAAGGSGPHAWVELDYEGVTYVCDPDFQNETRKNGYCIQYRQSGTWMYQNRSVMAE